MLTREQFVALLARLRGEGDALNVTELAAVAAYMEANAGDRDLLPDEEMDETLAAIRLMGAAEATTIEELEAAVAVVEAITATAAARAEVDAEVETQRNDLRARLGITDEPAEPAVETPAEEPVAETETPAPVETPEPATAEETPAEPAEPELVGATAAAPARPRINPGQLRARRPAGAVAVQEAARSHNRIVRDGGGEWDGIEQLAGAMYEKRAAFLSANNGISEYLTMGSVIAEYPEDRVLPQDEIGQMSMLGRMKDSLWNKPEAELAALTASGGFCAPAEPYYGLLQLADADRPFRASLTQFNAARGSITYRTPPDFPSFDAATGIWTKTNDATPGSDGAATKPCLTVVCNATQSADIYAVTECLTFGNFMARTDPETIANAVANTMAAFARKAEVKLIDAMKTASKAVTSGKAIGAYRDLSYDIRVAAAAYRSRHRMRRDAQLEIRMPYWVPDLVLADLVRNMPGDGNLDAAEDLWNRALAAARVTVAGYYMDSPTGANRQVFGPQNAATNLDDFPETVQWQLCAPGSFLLLDNGRLDLGIVRDSVLNKTNDYQTFAETFEGLAYVGIESLWVTSTVCANGQAAGLIDTSAFCSGDYVP